MLVKDPGFAKFVVLVNSAVPLALLAWDGYHHRLGADPVAFAIHTTGMLALIFLILSLAITPARLISGSNWLSLFRRMLGLYAFFYASLHLLIYWAGQRGFSIAAVISESIKRPFILFGMTGLLLMVPLAITSTNGMIKRMGAAKWKRLHQLAYVSGIAGVIHYYMFVKADHRQPIVFIGVLAVLLLYRLLVPWFPFLKYRKPPAVRAAKSDSRSISAP